MKLLSVVFSFRNEEKNLEELIKRTTTVLNKLTNWKYELIFVNDFSDDNSENILIKFQKTYPITIINMSRKFGVGPCVLAGLKHSNGDAAIYMDSDLQDPPELISKIIEKFESGVDVVHTVRTKRLGEGRIKLFLTNIAYKIINRTADIPLPVNAGDFKLLSRRAIDHINTLKDYNPYIRGLSVWIGFKQEFIEYVRESRFSGESKFLSVFSGPLAQFVRGITTFSTGPLYLGIYTGLLAIVLSLGLIIYALYAKFTEIAIPGSSGLIIIVALFSGIILMTIGITGVYIARIYEQTQGRPRYIIRNIIKSDEKK